MSKMKMIQDGNTRKLVEKERNETRGDSLLMIVKMDKLNLT